MPFDFVYEIVYHKYFTQAALGKITEKQSFEYAIQELNLEENWRELRKKHLSFQKLNKTNFKYFLFLKNKGYSILLFSKNTPEQFNYVLKKYKIKRYFKNIINTFDLKLPKASKKTIDLVLKKYNARPKNTIMIDDQDFNLIEPKKMGIKTILYYNHRQMKLVITKLLKNAA